MPRVSYFYGIEIYFYWKDHNPPHFHALYGEHEALIEVRTLRLWDGYLPPKAMAMVIEWSVIHKEELIENWNKVSGGIAPVKIEPLV